MKRIWTIILGLLLLVSCHTKEHYTCYNKCDNQESLFMWCDNFITKAKGDTTSIIPEYALSTDWMKRYVKYIASSFKIKSDTSYGRIDGEYFECRFWTLAHVDGDTIPEMLLYGGCWDFGAIVLTQHNGVVCASPQGYFSYIKGADGLLHSQWRYGDDAWGDIYEMKDGKFTEIASYECYPLAFDTNKIGSYPLSRDSLLDNNWGNDSDSIVGVCEVYTRIDNEHFDYHKGFAQVKLTLDSLYYSKGTSTYFPFPEKKMTIDILTSVK